MWHYTSHLILERGEENVLIKWEIVENATDLSIFSTISLLWCDTELTIPSDESHAHDQQSHEESQDIHRTELVDVDGLELRVTLFDGLTNLVHFSSIPEEFSNCVNNCVNSGDRAEDIGNGVT